MKNTDELCGARALVTMQSLADDRHQAFSNMRHDETWDETWECLAKQLHQQTRVPEGPCGLGELEQFKIVLSDYQIVVLSVDHAYQIIFNGPSKPDNKKLILVKVGEHYHGCTSLKGFLGRSYFSWQCEKDFSNDDYAHHPCQGKTCFACFQPNCLDYQQREVAQPSLLCTGYNRILLQSTS